MPQVQNEQGVSTQKVVNSGLAVYQIRQKSSHTYLRFCRNLYSFLKLHEIFSHEFSSQCCFFISVGFMCVCVCVWKLLGQESEFTFIQDLLKCAHDM